MADRAETAGVVYEALASLWPGRFEGRIGEDVPLGEDGLGLDSIEIVELLLACEERLGMSSVAAGAPLDSGPADVGRLIDHLMRA